MNEMNEISLFHSKNLQERLIVFSTRKKFSENIS